MAARPLAKMSADLVSGAGAPSARIIVETLAQHPEFVLDIIDDLIAAEDLAERDEDMIAAEILMLGTVLESIRYGVEAGKREAIALAEDARRLLVDAEAKSRIEPRLMLLILNQFVAAKLDVGEKLQSIMLRMLVDRASDASPGDLRDGQEGLLALASDLGGDPFEVHAHLNETAEALPPPAQAKLALSLLSEGDDGLTNAALGFLLSPAADVRAAIAHRFCEVAGGATADYKSAPVILRRIIALRNWLPASEQAILDTAIAGLHRRGVAASPWSKPGKLEAHVSGFDGSGMQAIFVIAKEGRKHAIAALIGRLGVGVRDAWVRHGASKREVKALLAATDDLGGTVPVGLDYVACAARQFLAGNAQTGSMPPFALLAFAECAGLDGLAPEATTVEELVGQLSGEIEPTWVAATTVDRILTASADWPDMYPLLRSWFETGNETTKLLAGKRKSKARTVAAILAGPVSEHRRLWAEKLAWMVLFTRAIADFDAADLADTPWREFAIAARELLGDRPIGEIGLMRRIAEQTVEANAAHDWP
jgi:hypothetical protein